MCVMSIISTLTGLVLQAMAHEVGQRQCSCKKGVVCDSLVESLDYEFQGLGDLNLVFIILELSFSQLLGVRKRYGQSCKVIL